MKRKRDFERFVSIATVDKILEVAMRNEIPLDCFEGSLMDSYIIYSDNELKVGNWKPRMYILAVETYKNAWESVYKLVLTDKRETVEKYFGKDFETRWDFA